MCAALSPSSSAEAPRKRQSQAPVTPTLRAPRWSSPSASATVMTRSSGRATRVHALAPSLVTMPFSSKDSVYPLEALNSSMQTKNHPKHKGSTLS